MRGNLWIALALLLGVALTGCDGTGNRFAAPGSDSGGATDDGGDGGMDDPGMEDPGTDDPGTDDPGTDDPGTDDPGTDDPGTDDPGTDDPGTDDPSDDGSGGDDDTAATVEESAASLVTALAGIAVGLSEASDTAQDAASGGSTSTATQSKMAFAIPCDSGSGTVENTSSPDFTMNTSRFEYADCRLGDSLFDGVLVTETRFSEPPTGPTPPSEFDGRNTSGENGVPFVIEILAPEADRARIAQDGVTDFTFVLDGDEPDTAEFLFRQTVEVVNLALADQPSVTSTLGDASTPYRSFFDFMDELASLEVSGPFEVSGDCGEGSGTVSTPTPIIFNQETGATSAGQLVVDSSEGTVTATFNPDGTVTIDTPSGSRTFSDDELEALCPV